MAAHAPTRPRRPVSRRAGLVAALALLAVVTVVANRVLPGWSLGGWAYPLVNGTAAVLLVVLARRCGLTAGELGLGTATLRRSALVGLAGAGAVGIAFLVATVVPQLRDLFDDERAAGLSAGWLLWVAAVRIPVGTVLLEEVAFRGVLPALLGGGEERRLFWRPALASSVLFGLWHVLPSMSLSGQNAALGSLFGGAGPVLVPLLAVAGSTVAGLWLCWWRYAGRGLLAPILVHLSTNSGGLLLAWFLAR